MEAYDKQMMYTEWVSNATLIQQSKNKVKCAYVKCFIMSDLTLMHSYSMCCAQEFTQ